MARHVYLALADRWGLAMFSGISRSETQHMSAMLSLLNRYSLKDPVGSARRGVFADSKIQGLNSTLVAQGRTSLVEALKVGAFAFIEDFDIAEIRTRLAMNPPAVIAAVYQNRMMTAWRMPSSSPTRSKGSRRRSPAASPKAPSP